MSAMYRFDTISDFTDADKLTCIAGPVIKLEIEPVGTIGYSGSTFKRIIIHTVNKQPKHLILKQTRLKADWLSLRSHDLVGREVALMEEPCLQKLWQHLHCPYIAFAREKDISALLMEDLSAGLFPDVREPISMVHEKSILNSIASVHARFWESNDIKNCSWLAKASNYFNLLRPGIHEQDAECPPPARIKDNITEGWKLALNLLPPTIRERLTQPVDKIVERWQDLPVTLLHGDLKIANMAILPDRNLVLFDWPMVGCAPCGIELGWYLAVNATRLARSKEAMLALYREFLEAHLGFGLHETTWKRMTSLAVLSGAMMMLWSKALALQSGTDKARQEWEWWLRNLPEALKMI